MQRELGYSAAQLTGALSLALLVSAIAVLAALPASGAERREADASFPEVVRL